MYFTFWVTYQCISLLEEVSCVLCDSFINVLFSIPDLVQKLALQMVQKHANPYQWHAHAAAQTATRDSITTVQVSLLDLVPKLTEKLKQHAFYGHHKHPDASLQVITDIYPLSFLTTLLTKMASHSLNSFKEQFKASSIMFQDQYIADESSVAHTLASAFH